MSITYCGVFSRDINDSRLMRGDTFLAAYVESLRGTDAVQST